MKNRKEIGDIKINDRWSIECDKYGWTRYERIPGTSREGEPIVSTYTTFPMRLDVCLERIIELSGQNCSTAQELLDGFNSAKRDIMNAIEDIKREERKR